MEQLQTLLQRNPLLSLMGGALILIMLMPKKRYKARSKPKATRSTTRKRKASKKRSSPTKSRTGKPAYMVKGSEAAKRHMAKLRKMRR